MKLKELKIGDRFIQESRQNEKDTPIFQLLNPFSLKGYQLCRCKNLTTNTEVHKMKNLNVVKV